MYTHASRRTLSSKSCPGVTFTVRLLSYGRRGEIAARLGRAFTPEGPQGDDLGAAIELMRALMSAMLVAVNGLEVDGRPFAGAFSGEARSATIEEFLDTAPEDLVDEICAALLAEARLDPDAEKNYVPPSGMSPAGTEGGSNAANAS